MDRHKISLIDGSKSETWENTFDFKYDHKTHVATFRNANTGGYVQIIKGKSATLIVEITH